MPDPVISPAADPVIIPTDSQSSAIDQILSDADSSRDDFLRQAQDAFDAAEGRQPTAPTKPSGHAPSRPAEKLNKPALSNAKSSASKPSLAAEPSASSAKTSTSRVPGPPVASDAPSEPTADPSTPKPLSDASHLPEDFKPGQIRSEQWKELRTLHKEARARAQAAEARIAELESSRSTTAAEPPPELTARLQSLQQANEQLTQQLEAVAIERSPRFAAQFQPRIEGAINLAKSAVGPELAEKVASLMSMPDNEFRNTQLEQIAEGLSGLRAGKFTTAIAEIDKINAEKLALSSRSSEIYKQWQLENQTRSEKERNQFQTELSSTFDQTVKAWSDFELFQPKEGDAAHNAAVQARIEQARSIFTGGKGMTRADLANASIWAAIAPDLVKDSHAKAQRIAELEAQLGALRGAEPGNASDAGSDLEDTPDDAGSTGYGDGIARLVQQAGHLR